MNSTTDKLMAWGAAVAVWLGIVLLLLMMVDIGREVFR